MGESLKVLLVISLVTACVGHAVSNSYIKVSLASCVVASILVQMAEYLELIPFEFSFYQRSIGLVSLSVALVVGIPFAIYRRNRGL
jgi:hypothetical protein